MSRIKKAALLIVIFWCMECILSWLLEPVTYAHYLDHDLAELKKEEKQPDVVLMGDSRIYRSLVPEIFDTELEDGSHCSLNAGTGSQTVVGSYYYLKDLMKRYPVKYVILELTYSNFLESAGDSAQAELVVMDRMKSLPLKLEYAGRSVSPSQWPYLLKSYRYRDQFAQIPDNIRMKLSKDTRSGVDIREEEHYEDRGFVWTKVLYEDGGIGFPPSNPAQWTDGNVKEEAFECLDQIRRMCEEEGAKLILVTGPTSLSTIYSVKEYEAAFRCFCDYADRAGLPYFELNLLRNRRELLPDSMMYDSDHVCGEGAARISEIFCEILNQYLAGEDVSSWFYSSVEEMKKDIHAVVACDLHTEQIEGSWDRMLLAESLQEDGAGAEYEFLISGEGENGDWEVLRPYGEENSCRIPGERLQENVWLRVNARLKGSTSAWEAFIVKEREPEEG